MKELVCRKARLDLDHAIDKPVLLGVADGLGLVEGGLSDESGLLALAYFRDCSPTVPYLVPDVGADSNEDDISSHTGGLHARFIAERLKGNEVELFIKRGDFRYRAPHLITFLDYFLILFRGNVNLFRALSRLFEVPYSLSNSLSNLWQFACPEYDEDDDQDND